MNERQGRILESIENMILHPSTPDNEKQAAIGRWEAITGEKWTGNPKTRSAAAASNSSGANSRSTNYNPWEDIFKKAGFGNYGDWSSNTNPFNSGYTYETHQYQKQQTKQKQSKANWSYDFGGGCTEKQYEYIKSICNFFRWKCPQRHEIEFDEAKEFLNQYAEMFQMFTFKSRNFSNLKKLFEAFGIDWNQTKRTFKWKAYGEK